MTLALDTASSIEWGLPFALFAFLRASASEVTADPPQCDDPIYLFILSPDSDFHGRSVYSFELPAAVFPFCMHVEEP
jgi:hypothetical protein